MSHCAWEPWPPTRASSCGVSRRRGACWSRAAPTWSGAAARVAPQQLCEHSCLVLDIGNSPRRWQLQRGRTELAVDVSGPLHSNNSFLLLTACRAGAGIGLLPATVATADVRNGQLSQVLSGWSSTEQGIYAVYPSARFIPAKVRAFVEFMAARLRGSGEN